MYPVWRPPQQRGRDPFSELDALRAELGRLIGSALAGQSGALPDVDLQETEAGWTVTARLPGVAPDEVEIEVGDREVCIRAKSEAEVEQNADRRAEVSRRRRFEYRLTLPGDLDPDNVDATMDHGLLVIRVPRLARSRRRQIAIGRRGEAIGTAAVPAGQSEPAGQGEPVGVPEERGSEPVGVDEDRGSEPAAGQFEPDRTDEGAVPTGQTDTTRPADSVSQPAEQRGPVVG
ncbi:MAG TPA: Hsp20/alpha crystallin family protein [Pilimelia sp.]|nr:Hsp20/alpha crystallin family protein [Pilimelia sp.]